MSENRTTERIPSPRGSQDLTWPASGGLAKLTEAEFEQTRSTLLERLKPDLHSGSEVNDPSWGYNVGLFGELILQCGLISSALLLLNLGRRGYELSPDLRAWVWEGFTHLALCAALAESQAQLHGSASEEYEAQLVAYVLRRLARDHIKVDPLEDFEAALRVTSQRLRESISVFKPYPVRWAGYEDWSMVRIFAAFLCDAVGVPDDGTKEETALDAVELAERMIDAIDSPSWISDVQSYFSSLPAPSHAGAAAIQRIAPLAEPTPVGSKSGIQSGGGAAPTATDIGLMALDLIHKQLMIDEPWTVREDRSFSWIAYRLLQTVQASPLRESREHQVSDVSVRTIVVRDVEAPPISVAEILAKQNAESVGSAFMYLPEFKSIISICAYHVHEQTLEYRSAELASYAILQLYEAEVYADELAAAVHGKVAREAHPDGGFREVPDGMMAAVRDVFLPAGSKPSAFADPREMAAVASLCDESPFATMGSGIDGVCIEVPFGESDSTLITLKPQALHRWLGSGLLVTTSLRPTDSREKMALTSQLLQHNQITTLEGGGRLGGWGVRELAGTPYVTWSRFVPNLLFSQGHSADIALAEINRALWVDKLLFPHLPMREAWSVMRRKAATMGHLQS